MNILTIIILLWTKQKRLYINVGKFSIKKIVYLFILFLPFSLVYCQTPNLPILKNSPEKRLTKQKKLKPNSVIITAMGDVALNFYYMDDLLAKLAKKYGWDYAYKYPFSKVLSEFKGIVFGNLEAPITRYKSKTYPDKDEIFLFQADPGTEKILKNAGFHIMSLANNHILDCGEKGMFDTAALLEKVNIRYTGIEKNLQKALQPVILIRNSLKVAFLAFNLVIPRSVYATPYKSGTASGSMEILSEAVRQAKKKSDIVVVSIHWGKEVGSDKRVEPQHYQRKLAYDLIDAGALLILGHHSHAPGIVENYKKGIIFYSLGDFIFAGRHTANHKDGIFVRVTLTPKEMTSYTIVPVNINPLKVKYQPRILKPKLGKKVINRILIQKNHKYEDYYKLKNSK